MVTIQVKHQYLKSISISLDQSNGYHHVTSEKNLDGTTILTTAENLHRIWSTTLITAENLGHHRMSSTMQNLFHHHLRFCYVRMDIVLLYFRFDYERRLKQSCSSRNRNDCIITKSRRNSSKRERMINQIRYSINI